MRDANPTATFDDLVAANRILADAGVVDAFGHVSARSPADPAHFLMARSRSPELVERTDILAFDLAGNAIAPTPHALYVERFIHAAIYAARPDVAAVVHSHADEVVPFSISRTPLRPVLHTAASIGTTIPVWDIRERFGAHTNLLVTTLEQGRDLAERLGSERVVLMRGHGFAATGGSIYEAVKTALYLPRNAAILATALTFGGDVIELAPGEVAAVNAIGPDAPSSRRAWEYWCAKAGVGAGAERTA